MCWSALKTAAAIGAAPTVKGSRSMKKSEREALALDRALARREGEAEARRAVEAQAQAERDAQETERDRAEVKRLAKGLADYELESLPPPLQAAVRLGTKGDPQARVAMIASLKKNGAVEASASSTAVRQTAD